MKNIFQSEYLKSIFSSKFMSLVLKLNEYIEIYIVIGRVITSAIILLTWAIWSKKQEQVWFHLHLLSMTILRRSTSRLASPINLTRCSARFLKGKISPTFSSFRLWKLFTWTSSRSFSLHIFWTKSSTLTLKIHRFLKLTWSYPRSTKLCPK